MARSSGGRPGRRRLIVHFINRKNAPFRLFHSNRDTTGDEFSGKWLELLREAVPRASRIAVLLNPAHPASVGYMTVLRGTAQKLGVKLHLQEVWDPGQFDSAFATIVAERAQALVVLIDPLTVRYRGRIRECSLPVSTGRRLR
jgi:hypothetical protein